MNTPAATPALTVLHLSDLHARSDGPLYGVIDAPARVRRIAAVAEGAQIAPDAIVVTGDLVDHADRAAYPPVADALEELSTALDAPVLAVPGNHDAPEFEADLSNHPALRRHRLDVGPWRLLGLDTGAGDLAATELGTLRRALSEPHRTGTILVMHHSPVASPLPSLRGIGLHRPEALGGLIAGSDVRAVLCGHYHHALSAQFAGVPVWVGPALSYAQIMDAGAGQVQGQDVAGFSVVRLDAAGATATPYPLASRPPLFTVAAGSKTGRPTPPGPPAPRSSPPETRSSPQTHPSTAHPHDPHIPITQITPKKTQKG
ncbi:MAG: metallophosphoesterase [Pseudoclavibacter sp.]